MKILVTGGAGFIGSHLVDHLVGEGHEVVVLDNFVTGRLSNLAQHEKSDQLRVVDVDIREEKLIAPHFVGVDWVVHLAALADIVPSIERPRDYFTTNVTGTMNVLEAAREAKVKRFVYVASSSCYGIPEELPTNEEAKICPEYPYALTKYLGEETALHWGKVYDMPVVCLRFFNVYGPRGRTAGTYGAVFGVFLAQRLNNKPLTIVGDGTQTRDFTYVTDIARALLLAAQSDVKGEIFNVGSGGTYSVNSLAELIGGRTVHIPKRPGEPESTFADISKIRNVLGYEPQIEFSDGVKRMLDKIDDWHDAPVWTDKSIEKSTASWFKHLS